MDNSEDEALWRRIIQDVAPIEHKTQAEIKQRKIVAVKNHQQYAAKQDFSTYSKNLEDQEFGGVDAATVRRFKREEFKIEAVLDLHGLTEKEAYEQVCDFVTKCFNKEKRCIIIVTGKGVRHEETDDLWSLRGVLKKRVPQWLNMPQLRGMILLYKNPSERLGGEGALYILLKRHRK